MSIPRRIAARAAGTAAALLASAAVDAAGAQVRSRARRPNPIPPAAVVDSLTAAYNAHATGRFAQWLSDTVTAGGLTAPAGGVAGVVTRGRAAMREQARQAFAAHPGLRVTGLARVAQGELVVDRERLDGLPGGPRDNVVVLRVQGGRVVRIWTAPAPPVAAR